MFPTKNSKKQPGARNSAPTINWRHKNKICIMESSIVYSSSWYSLPTQSRSKGGSGEKIIARIVVRAKVGELEEEIRKLFIRWVRKYFTGVVFRVVVKGS